MDRRRLFYFLLLNIFVSACVTGAILFWYDRNYRAQLVPSAPVAAPATQAPATQAAADEQTLQPESDVPVEIVSIVGAGNLSAEAVIIRYNGEDVLPLAGWKLQDDNGNTYTFPQLELYKNGAVQLHTASGTNTVVDLYWGLRQPVWDSGETARLYDDKGDLRAVYDVP